MKRIDQEIFEVENRLHAREALIRQTASATRQRMIKSLSSPVAIAGAAALGFLIAGGVGRGRAKGPAQSRETKDQTKGFALGGLLMTAAAWFLRSQFGGPVGLAQAVLSKVKNKGSPPGDSRSAQTPR